MWPAKKVLQEGESNEAAEAFVAAYRSGNAELPAATPVTVAGTAPVIVPATPSASRPPASTPARDNAFISGAVKVAYLSIKAGMRDHHVFAHVAMTMLPGPGEIDPALAQARLDLLVCNAEMKPVAAVDIIGLDTGPADAARLAQLRVLGIRYLRLPATSLPRPGELRALIYRT